jgi:hypothetical protein
MPLARGAGGCGRLGSRTAAPPAGSSGSSGGGNGCGSARAIVSPCESAPAGGTRERCGEGVGEPATTGCRSRGVAARFWRFLSRRRLFALFASYLTVGAHGLDGKAVPWASVQECPLKELLCTSLRPGTEARPLVSVQGHTPGHDEKDEG